MAQRVKRAKGIGRPDEGSPRRVPAGPPFGGFCLRNKVSDQRGERQLRIRSRFDEEPMPLYSLRAAERLFAKLTPRQREALVLRRREHMSFKEMRDTMRISKTAAFKLYQQPAQDSIQAAARSRLAILKDPVVSYVEGSDEESRREQIAEILSDGVYSWVKKRGFLDNESGRKGQ